MDKIKTFFFYVFGNTSVRPSRHNCSEKLPLICILSWKSFIAFQVQEMIELALDALPTYDDDTPPPRRQNQSDNVSDSQSTNVLTPTGLDSFDKELCLLVDEEASTNLTIWTLVLSKPCF